MHFGQSLSAFRSLAAHQYAISLDGNAVSVSYQVNSWFHGSLISTDSLFLRWFPRLFSCDPTELRSAVQIYTQNIVLLRTKEKNHKKTRLCTQAHDHSIKFVEKTVIFISYFSLSTRNAQNNSIYLIFFLTSFSSFVACNLCFCLCLSRCYFLFGFSLLSK